MDDELEYPAEIRSITSILSLDRINSLIEEEVFKKQIIFADRIIMNKMVKKLFKLGFI